LYHSLSDPDPDPDPDLDPDPDPAGQTEAQKLINEKKTEINLFNYR